MNKNMRREADPRFAAALIDLVRQIERMPIEHKCEQIKAAQIWIGGVDTLWSIALKSDLKAGRGEPLHGTHEKLRCWLVGAREEVYELIQRLLDND